MNSNDIIIVGAGPVGIYFGWQLARKKHSVLIIERHSREECGSKMDQFHLETMVFEKYGIAPPKEGTDEFITNFEWTSYYGPYGKYPQIMKYPVTAMRFQFFIRRLIKLAEADGVTFQFSSEYKLPILKENKLVGIKYETEGQIIEAFGKLIVDSTGSSAIVRRSLPAEFGVETFKIELQYAYIDTRLPDDTAKEVVVIMKPYLRDFFIGLMSCNSLKKELSRSTALNGLRCFFQRFPLFGTLRYHNIPIPTATTPSSSSASSTSSFADSIEDDVTMSDIDDL